MIATLSIDDPRLNLVFRDAAHLDQIIDGLRRAGLTTRSLDGDSWLKVHLAVMSTRGEAYPPKNDLPEAMSEFNVDLEPFRFLRFFQRHANGDLRTRVNGAEP